MLARSIGLLLPFSAALWLSACTSSIKPLGSLGPNKVYSVSNSNFLTASEMLVVLNKNGDVAAYTGGTTAGAGTVGLETGASVLTAGAIAYAGRSLANAHIKGIPSNIHVAGNIDSTHVINVQH